MKSICLCFQIHQPFRLKKYSFFDMGEDHYYYDDFMNENIIRKTAEKCYIPTNKLLLDLINKYKGKFKVTFSISGTALDQFELYAPEVIDSFKDLAETGRVEFLAETNSHSLVSLYNKDLFKKEVKIHSKRITKLLNIKKPKVLKNTELIYSDLLGKDIYDMGYKGVIAEGAKHVLGWKSPNFLYCNPLEPKLKLLLRNYELSDLITNRFGDSNWEDYPLTADKFVSKFLKPNLEDNQSANIFINYETFGYNHSEDTGIFSFLEHLPEAMIAEKIKFTTPSKAISKLDVVSEMSIPHKTSWADEERDISAWLGNDMQKEAFEKLYNLAPFIKKIKDKKLTKDWEYLQSSDAFYYMSTKWFTDGEHYDYNPYPSPYDAFLNYMNILSDFTQEVSKIESSEQRSEDLIEDLKHELEQKEKQIKNYEEIIKSF